MEAAALDTIIPFMCPSNRRGLFALVDLEHLGVHWGGGMENPLFFFYGVLSEAQREDQHGAVGAVGTCWSWGLRLVHAGLTTLPAVILGSRHGRVEARRNRVPGLEYLPSTDIHL